MAQENATHKPFFTIGRSLLLAVALLALGGLIWGAGFEKRFEVTEAEAQRLLDEQVAKYVAEHPEVTVTHAILSFGDNQLTIDVAGGKSFATSKYGEYVVTTSVSATGDPDYRQRSVYFNPSKSSDAFDFKELALNGEDPLMVAKRAIAALARKSPGVRDAVLENNRVTKGLGWLKEKAGVNVEVDTTISDATIKLTEAAADEFVEQYRKPAEFFMEHLVVRLLETTPLYTLDHSWKETVAAAALTDIGIVDGKLTATITGWQLIKTVLFLLVLSIAFIVIGIGVVRSGGVGLLFLGGLGS